MRKCIVLDLDNTLWGGVIGEDGMEGIALSTKEPGASYIAFQQALLDLYDRGIILAINSQNNEADALEVIKTHPNMILKEKHFAASRINWKDKVENMKEIAEELNIGLDSLVFLDDNPINRAAMREYLPQVETPELPQDPTEYTKFLNSLPYFEQRVLTDEDKMRGNLYVTERLRAAAEKEFESREAFLKSLGLELHMYTNDAASFARLAQLTEKTNQFNTKKSPLSVEELEAYRQDGEHIIMHARVSDRFGDHGITAFALVRMMGLHWSLESLLLSCRVLGRSVEEAFLYAIGERARTADVQTLSVAFTPSEKNKPAKDFVERNWKDTHLFPADITKPEWITIFYEKL
ncbi:MAG TPA: HAD-IIIC family phosphatase [Candidatus Paceibacterota bacterium]